ncbi:MAG: response regulator [Verrucomicrobiales bacterium]|nr:response regulator [Verrucomicrobiales bacterium]
MSSAGSAKPIDILLVEDSPTDALMTREALAFSKILNQLHVVTDGVEALAFLRRQGSYSGAPRPDLILLDLNLPKKTGAEVLREIKADPSLGSIPVVVLSTSQAEEDINRSYGLHASCYITKPVEFPKFAEVVQSIRHFWFSVVTLPVDSK